MAYLDFSKVLHTSTRWGEVENEAEMMVNNEEGHTKGHTASMRLGRATKQTGKGKKAAPQG